MESKCTVVSWDGKTIVFDRALLDTKGDEYHIQDMTKHDVHYVFPKANIFYVKEEHCD